MRNQIETKKNAKETRKVEDLCRLSLKNPVLIEVSNLDEVYAFFDPSIPVHMLVRVKLNAARLQTDYRIIYIIFTREDEKIEGISHILIIFKWKDEGYPHLNDVKLRCD